MLDLAEPQAPAIVPAADRTTDLPAGGRHDPLCEDRADDPILVITERRLVRLLSLAADIGVRFADQRIHRDPVGWMLEPKRLLGGERAIDACQNRDDYVTATLFHGLRIDHGLGADGDPSEVRELLLPDGDEPDGLVAHEEPVGCDPRFAAEGDRVYTSLVEGRLGVGGRGVRALCATRAPDEATARRRLRVRYGEALASAAEVVEGFPAASPLARALASGPMARMIQEAAAEPSGPIALGLDVHVEQRFVA